MTQHLRKAIANRSRRENQYYKLKSDESLKDYKRQKNYCSRLYKKERKRYYSNLDVKKVSDNKTFWRTVKPFLSDKGAGRDAITLIGDDILQEDTDVVKVLGDFFSKAVESLNIKIPNEYFSEISSLSNDPIDQIISKYRCHPSIKLISDNIVKTSFSFRAVSSSDVVKEIKALDPKKASIASSIPSKFLKENINTCCEPLKYIINEGISS